MRHQTESLGSLPTDTILVFGGVSLEGFQNARKLADHWTSLDRGVVWFDGFPGDEMAQPTEGLIVVDYGARESDRWLNRLERTEGGVGRFLARFLKRWNTATRGYASLRLIRREVAELSNRLAPVAIFYCDEHALTAAWHAARLWPETPVTRAPAR